MSENDRVIATKWRFAPGDQTGRHSQGYDYAARTEGKLVSWRRRASGMG